MGAPDPETSRAAGVWTLAGDELIIAERDGPATMLVPTESVLLLGVDLPLSSRAKRLEALPFAIEDRIAEPLSSVHIALGAELSPKRYLVAVVRHDLMRRWTDIADASGMGHAAMVPDALALPVAEDGGWSVDLSGNRAVVRVGDGTGFATAASLLGPAWDAAGQPPVTAYGDPLPAAMAGEGASSLDPGPLAARLAAPPIDLRQGEYARRSAGSYAFWRRLGWIAAIGIVAHIVIAAADTLMLGAIADRREDTVRALVMEKAPNAAIGDDLATSVTDLLPQGGGGAPQVFVPLMNRVSAALAPMAGSFTTRAIGYSGGAVTLDLDPLQPGLAARIQSALAGSGIAATATEAPDGSVRVAVSGQ